MQAILPTVKIFRPSITARQQIEPEPPVHKALLPEELLQVGLQTLQVVAH